jgi:chromosome segregation ATPase
MATRNFMDEILSDAKSSAQQKLSVSEQLSQMLTNLQKPSFSETSKNERNSQKCRLENLNTTKNIDKVSPPHQNPRYEVNAKNFVKLVDKNDALESKVESLSCKIKALEHDQASMQKKINNIETTLKSYEDALSKKETLHPNWKWFSFGVLTTVYLFIKNLFK